MFQPVLAPLREDGRNGVPSHRHADLKGFHGAAVVGRFLEPLPDILLRFCYFIWFGRVTGSLHRGPPYQNGSQQERMHPHYEKGIFLNKRNMLRSFPETLLMSLVVPQV